MNRPDKLRHIFVFHASTRCRIRENCNVCNHLILVTQEMPINISHILLGENPYQEINDIILILLPQKLGCKTCIFFRKTCYICQYNSMETGTSIYFQLVTANALKFMEAGQIRKMIENRIEKETTKFDYFMKLEFHKRTICSNCIFATNNCI